MSNRKEKALHAGKHMRLIIGVALLLLATFFKPSFAQFPFTISKYNGTTLDISTAVGIAFKNNPDFTITQARVAQAEEQLKEMRSLLYPTLILSASYERIEETAGAGASQFRSSDTDVAAGQIEARYVISLKGSRKAAIAEARKEAIAFTLDEKQVQNLLVHQVRAAYYSILLTREAIEIAKQSLAFSRLQMDQAEARLEAGLGLKTDLLTFSVRVSENETNLQETRNASRLAMTALSELLAMDVPNDVALVFPELSINPLEKLPKDQLIQDAFKNRPDLKALEKRVDAAREAVTVKKAALLPRVELYANYGFTKESNLSITDDDDEAAMGVTLSMDLFDGGSNRSRVQKSRERVSEIEGELSNTRLSVLRQIEDILNNIADAKSRLVTNRKTIRLAEENLELRTVRFKAGVGTILEVTEGEVQLSQARLTELQAKIDLLTARSKLNEVVGVMDFQKADAAD
jgi:outer membrane protein